MTASKNTEKRLRILDEDEIEALYARPHFTEEERIEYFSLSLTEMAALEQLHSIKARIYFILQLGYVKARQLFFSFSLEKVEDDVRFIRARYFSDILLTDLEITKVTRLKQQRLILELCGYRHCGAKERRQLDVKAPGGDDFRQTGLCVSRADALSGPTARRDAGLQFAAGYG